MRKFGYILTTLSLLISFVVCDSCTHPVYCVGPVLNAVQRAQIFNDSKTFVDMPMIYPPEQILSLFNESFGNGSNANLQELTAFVNTYFLPAGSDLVDVIPLDWVPSPEFVYQFNNSDIRAFALSIHLKWRDLVRAWNDSFCDGCFSHIPVPRPFVIAGSRFREFYYWDSYWTIQGLLVSGMVNTTKGVLQNFLELVEQLGFLPNGGRIYYLNRSQPPLLTQMVMKYYEITGDLELVEQALPILNSEYEYWMSNTSVEPASGMILNRYYVVNDRPRPESYLEDVTLAETVDPSYAPILYQQLATGAETGWDFSSRWMENQPNLNSLITTEIIPVDLNSILYKNEMTLASLYDLMKMPNMQALYERRAKKRLQAIHAILWNPDTQIWNDRYLNGTFDERWYPSNFFPFWAGAFEELSTDQVATIIANLSDILSYPGGVPVSIYNTGQQWDFPNGWAPLQYMMIYGLNAIAQTPRFDQDLRDKCSSAAFELASNWLTSNYCAWNATGLMFEKYDVTTRGVPGGGGEYVVQDGFGWTNGVALHYLQYYGNNFVLNTCGN